MLKMKNVITSVLAVMVTVGIGGTAQARALNLNETSAGVAIPFLVDGGQRRFTECLEPCESRYSTTEAVITNAGASDITLHFDLIDGDSSGSVPITEDFPSDQGDWETQNFSCKVTARETVHITFEHHGNGNKSDVETEVTFECDENGEEFGEPSEEEGTKKVILSEAGQGVLWVTVQNDAGDVVADNVLFANFTILSDGDAYGSTAAGFQGLVNDGNHDYVMDGAEYAQYPALLATNYLPPEDFSGELIVFTLDGTSGFPPFVRIGLEWYDDDEISQSDFFEFECFDVVEYEDVAQGLAVLETAGHMEMEPREAFGFPPHADDFSRTTPFLCYNVQVGDGGSFMWPCAQSTAVFTPDLGDDQPNLKTGR